MILILRVNRAARGAIASAATALVPAIRLAARSVGPRPNVAAAMATMLSPASAPRLRRERQMEGLVFSFGRMGTMTDISGMRRFGRQLEATWPSKAGVSPNRYASFSA